MVNMVSSPESAWYSPETQIILITPPPINTFQWGPFTEARGGKLDRAFNVTKEYADAVKNLGAELGITVVDIWSVFWDAAGRNEQALAPYMSDGLHLTEAGYKVASYYS
jgi:lysophospholipase L1-like esterase